MQRVIQSVLAAATLRGTATTTGAEGVMKQCGEQWQAAKSAGTTNGGPWPQFLSPMPSSAWFRSCDLLPAASLKQAPYFSGKRRPLLAGC
jgi:hypothetical protein